MDFTGKIEPAEGYLAVRFVDDDDEADEEREREERSSGRLGEPVPYEGCLAVVASVGPKCSAKAGDTIVTRPYARDGIRIGSGLVLIENYCVLAKLN